MKKGLIALLVAVVIVFGGFVLTACGQTDSNDKLVIYTSFYPIYDFAKNVGGDKVEVINLVKPGEEAHHYEPTTGQMAGMETADLIVINGQDMESWVDGLSSSLQSKVIDTSVGVNTIKRTTNDNPIYNENDEENQNSVDPHIWLSLKNAVKQMENIKNALVQIDPDNATYYQERFQSYSYMFNGLDYEFTTALAELENRNMVVSHRAFGYIAYEYNLIQYSLSGIESDTEPTPATLATIVDFINNNNITAVFYQTLTNSQVAQQISQQTNANLYVLSTLEALTSEEMANGETYFTIMARNLTTLVNALS